MLAPGALTLGSLSVYSWVGVCGSGEGERVLALESREGTRASPLRGLEGVPGLPGAPQDEAGLTRKFET